MARRIFTRAITPDEQSELRAVVREATWKPSTSEEYRDAPHSYIVKFRKPGELGAAQSPAHWDRFADLIKHCGVYRTWKGNRAKYLLLDGMCYWVIWPVLNRADASTLEPCIIPQHEPAIPPRSDS